jgi:hypothetical protein
MLLGSHLPNLFLVHRVRSSPPQQMLNSGSMVDMDRAENLPYPLSHMKASTNKPRPPKCLSKDISKHSLNHRHRQELSPLLRANSLRTTQLILSNAMLTAITSNSMLNRVHRVNRKVLHRSRDHTAVMVVHKPKELLNSPRVQLSSRSRDLPQQEKAKTVVIQRQTQLPRPSNRVLLQLPNPNQATRNNPKPRTTHMDTLTTRAHIILLI